MTPDQIEEMRRDMEAGTPGPWLSGRSKDCGWYLDTPGDNCQRSVGPNGRLPVAIVAVNSAFGKDWLLDANARRIARVPQLEAEVLRLRDALQSAEAWIVDGGHVADDEVRGGQTGAQAIVAEIRAALKGTGQ